MKSIEFKIEFGEGGEEFVTVQARSINSGFTKALRLAREPLGNSVERELHSVSFWQVKD